MKWIKARIDKEGVFFIGYIFFLVRNTWISTMIPFPTMINYLLVVLSAFCLLLKIFFYDEYKFKMLLALIIAAVCVAFALIHGRYVIIAFWFLMVVAAKGISFKKIMEVFLVITGAFTLLAFILSLAGVIENLQYDQSRGLRNSFGVISPTDFASHVFYWLLGFAYLMGEHLKCRHYFIMTLIGIWTYYFCRTRLDSSCILILVILFSIGNYITETKKYILLQLSWYKVWRNVGSWVMAILAFISIGLTFVYSVTENTLKPLNSLLSNRLGLGARGVKEYGIRLWGQPVEMNGYGGAVKEISDYFFVDCSYVLVLLRYGVVFLILLLIIYYFCCQKNRHDIYFLYAIALVSLNCTIAHHIIDIAYNPFALAFFAESTRKEMGIRDGGAEKTQIPLF